MDVNLKMLERMFASDPENEVLRERLITALIRSKELKWSYSYPVVKIEEYMPHYIKIKTTSKSVVIYLFAEEPLTPIHIEGIYYQGNSIEVNTLESMSFGSNYYLTFFADDGYWEGFDSLEAMNRVIEQYESFGAPRIIVGKEEAIVVDVMGDNSNYREYLKVDGNFPGDFDWIARLLKDLLYMDGYTEIGEHFPVKLLPPNFQPFYLLRAIDKSDEEYIDGRLKEIYGL